MNVLISYDISSNKKRARLHRFLKEFGLNTQKSVFECELDEAGLSHIISYCRQLINPGTDSVRMYRICVRCLRKVQISGLGIKITQLEYMIV
ncbi:MAG: CRISPR-associated endonuclease Cas2 [Desulfuromonadaceae bacterium]|nr:CRISPR-associated endonuclease Cas2 [Desulfuromonadaceae bacterium]MDD2855888.1 CRISPR-associated endonuclease Cas2 [Desulfuromonadaceae bacterium]